MKKLPSILLIAGALAPGLLTAEPALTIYNQNFAIVRDTVPLDLQAGVNSVRYADATAQVEPDSVIPARSDRQAFASDFGAELPQ
ncbi:MAG: hypothetical protein WBW41_06300 [Verrucomicrobiia bacterium]